MILFLFCFILSTLIFKIFFIETINSAMIIFVNYYIPLLLTEDSKMVAVFDTAATVMASFVALVFSISLVMIQIGSSKYSFKILEYFVHEKRTRALFGLSMFTILLAIFLMWFNIANKYSFTIIFAFFIVWMVLFWYFFINMVRITNPEQIAEIMIEDCNSQIKKGNKKKVESTLYSIAETTINAVYRNDFEFSLKFASSFFDIYQNTLINHSNWAKKLIFQQFWRIVESMIETKNNIRNYLWADIFNVPIYEILNEEEIGGKVDYEFIDYYIGIFIFNINKKLIDKDDFEGYRNEIREYSIIHIQNNPRMIQDDIRNSVIQEQMSVLTDIRNESDLYDKIIEHYNKLNFSIFQKSTMDFNHIQILKNEYLNYKTFVEISLKQIAPLDQNLTEKLAQLKNNSKDVIHEIDSLYIAYKFHFVFFIVGSYLVFKKDEENFEAQTYIKELWEFTDSKNARVINSDRPPICFDPNWLTHLWLYGGTGKESFIFSTSLHFTFDTFRDPEQAITTYYLLCLTRTMEINKNLQQFPDHDFKEDYYVKYGLQFSKLFIEDSERLQKNCDELIRNAKDWNLLFDNKAPELFSCTKKWITEKMNYCKSLIDDTVKNLECDQTKFQAIKDLISDSFNKSSSIKDLINIREIDNEIQTDIDFIQLGMHLHYPKENLVNDDFIYSPIALSEHLYQTMGRNIASRERNYLIRTIHTSQIIEKYTLSVFDIESVFEKINEKYQILTLKGYKPSCIILPMKFFRKLYNINAIDKKSTEHILLHDGNVLKAMFLPYSNFEEIILINQNFGIWTYKKQENAIAPLNIIFEENDCKLNIDISAFSELHFEIINSEAAIILQFPENPPVRSRWSNEMFDMTSKFLMDNSEKI